MHAYLNFILTKSQHVPQDCSKDIRVKQLHLDKCPLWLTSPKPFLKIRPNRLYKSLSTTTWHLHHRGWHLLHIFLNSIVFMTAKQYCPSQCCYCFLKLLKTFVKLKLIEIINKRKYLKEITNVVLAFNS